MRIPGWFNERGAIALTLALVTFSVYAKSFDYGFFSVDDHALLVERPEVGQGLTLESVQWAFTNRYMGNWIPVSWLSHALDYEVFGSDPGGHHFTSVVIHVFNSLLLFALLDRMTGRTRCSGFVAALFALHPLHVESVVWISERKDVLAAGFAFAACWFYVSYARGGGRVPYLWCAAFFAAGLMSKSTVVTLPCVLLLLDYWPLGRMQVAFARGRSAVAALVVEKLPLLGISAVFSVITWWAQRDAGAVVPWDVLPLDERLANAAVSYVIYLKKALWPTGLSIIYVHPYLFGEPGLSELIVVDAVAVLLLVTLIVIRGRRAGWPLVGWLWYLGTLVPMIGLVQVGIHAMANRYTYIPLIGVFILMVWGAAAIIERSLAANRRLVAPYTAAALALLVSLTVAAWREVGFWQDPALLFQRSLASGQGRWLLHFQLGRQLLFRDLRRDAIGHFRLALMTSPRRGTAALSQAKGRIHFNLGYAHELEGDRDRALSHYRLAVQMSPRFAPARSRLDALRGSGSEHGRPPPL